MRRLSKQSSYRRCKRATATPAALLRCSCMAPEQLSETPLRSAQPQVLEIGTLLKACRTQPHVVRIAHSCCSFCVCTMSCAVSVPGVCGAVNGTLCTFMCYRPKRQTDLDCHVRAGVLCEDSRRAEPLGLAASKSAVGHSEPASGLVGLLAAQHAICAALQRPIMHLDALSTHIEALLSQPWEGPGQSQHGPLSTGVFIPRQPAPAGAATGNVLAAASCAGVSAFAFQGTNAHAVVRQQRQTPVSGHRATTSTVELQWRLRVYWAAPLTGKLAERVARATVSEVTVQLRLRQPGLVSVLDHRVQVRIAPSSVASPDGLLIAEPAGQH